MEKVWEFFPIYQSVTGDGPNNSKNKAFFLSRKAQRPHTHLLPMKFLPICHHNSMSLSIISHNKIKFIDRDYSILHFKKWLGNKYINHKICGFLVCKLWQMPSNEVCATHGPQHKISIRRNAVSGLNHLICKLKQHFLWYKFSIWGKVAIPNYRSNKLWGA